MRNKSIVSKASNLIGQRLKYEMKARGVSSTELAQRADVKTSFLYDVISGKSSNPSTVKLARVAEGLGITLASLLGPQALEDARPQVKLHSNDYVAIPYLDTGEGSVPHEHQPLCFLSSWISKSLGAHATDLRVFTIASDNMEPTLTHNDIVLVDIGQKNPTQPGIYVLFDGYGVAVKRIERVMNATPPRIRLISDNPQYSIYEASPTDAGIIGRVVWFSRCM